MTEKHQCLVLGEWVTDDTLREVADARARLHADDRSSRPLSPDYELIGLLGEREFSRQSGLPMDLALRRRGDGGRNFTMPDGRTVHVTAARNPVHLLVEAGKSKADVHVLSQVHGDLAGATLLGWETDQVARLHEKRTMPGYTIMNHAVPAHSLRPIKELIDIIMGGEG